jgi:muramoyltetrapeptide carboxypeptidase
VIRPPALFPGARVGLVAPAGPVAPGGIERALEHVHALGWEPVLGPNARGRHGFLAAPDEARLADLEAAMAAPDVHGIWMLRGGYGTMRILDRVRWEIVAERPKPIIGFSDNTALHLALGIAGLASFHGPNAAAPELPAFARQGLRALLEGDAPAGEVPEPAGAPARETIAPGVAEGPLVGGNLAMVAATLGTPYAIRARGAILVLEEVGEHAYRIDRLLTQLRLAGVLDEVSGVALGAFSKCPDEGLDGIPHPSDILRERLAGLEVPVLSGLPIGHISDQWTLPLGVRARLDATAQTLEILEPAVTSRNGRRNR